MPFPITFSLEIDSVQKHPKAGTLEIRQIANGRATASCSIISEDRSYRVPLDADLQIVENGVTIFGGLVNQPRERGLGGGHHPSIVMPISAGDYNALLERRVALTTIPAGTMKEAFEQLRFEYLDEYSITLHGSQVNGPNLPYIEFGGWKLPDAFNHLLVLAGPNGSPAEMYTYWIDFNKVLRIFLPSTQPAPFDLLGDDLPEVIGDIEVEASRDQTYANKVILRIPATATTPDIYVYAEDFTQSGLYGHVDFYDVLHDQPTQADAQDRADMELAKRAVIKRIVRYRTFEGGLHPGMSQVIDVPARNVDATGVITEIVTRDFGRDRLIREVTVTVDDSQTNINRHFGDRYKDWARDTKGAGSGQVASTALAPAPPEGAIQHYFAGVFGGKSTGKFYRDENSMHCGGGGTSIDAADHESCVAFGYNNHIDAP